MTSKNALCKIIMMIQIIIMNFQNPLLTDPFVLSTTKITAEIPDLKKMKTQMNRIERQNKKILKQMKMNKVKEYKFMISQKINNKRKPAYDFALYAFEKILKKNNVDYNIEEEEEEGEDGMIYCQYYGFEMEEDRDKYHAILDKLLSETEKLETLDEEC